MPDPHLTPDPFAAALAKLRPAPAAVEQPAFLYLAGQASRDGIVRRWKVAAAIAAFALVVSWATGYVLYSNLQHRAAVAEEQLWAIAVVPPLTEPPAPVVSQPPYPVPAPPPAPAPVPYFDPDPTPQELADALRQRNDILTAGLTLLPAARPPDRPAPNDIRHLLPGGVFAAPRMEPKSKDE